MQIEVWSDVVCPWCFIGKRRLETALERFRDQVEVVWRSFQLDPSILRATHPTLPALAAKYGTSEDAMRANMTRVEQVAADEGLEYHLAEGISGNTSLAHELLHHAAEHGRQGELKERLLFAHFTEARSVFDVDSLVALAAEVGLDGDEARAALTDRRYRTAVRRDVATAQALGATGVPSSWSTGSTAPPVPSRPTCCCRSSSAPGPRATRWSRCRPPTDASTTPARSGRAASPLPQGLLGVRGEPADDVAR